MSTCIIIGINTVGYHFTAWVVVVFSGLKFLLLCFEDFEDFPENFETFEVVMIIIIIVVVVNGGVLCNTLFVRWFTRAQRASITFLTRWLKAMPAIIIPALTACILPVSSIEFTG